MHLLRSIGLAVLLAPGLTSCFPRIYSVEQFVPLQAESSIPATWERGPISAGDAARLRGQPEAIVGRLPHAIENDRLSISVVFRETGTYLAGIILPFIPLFGAGGEPDSYPIAVHVTNSVQPLHLDRTQMRLFLDDQPDPLLPDLESGFEHSRVFVYPATYRDAQRLRLEMRNPLPGDRQQDIVVHFEKDSALELSVLLLGGYRRPSLTGPSLQPRTGPGPEHRTQ